MTTEKERIAKLVEENMELVHYTFNQYFHRNLDEDRFMSAGNFGLFRAARTYDETKGVRFSSYAVKCIFNEMYRIIQSEKTVKRSRMQTVSLEEPVRWARRGVVYLHEVIPDETDFTEHVVNKIVVRQLMNNLDETERWLICQHFGLDGYRPMTQREIGRRLGVSGEAISQRIRKILKKMRLEYFQQQAEDQTRSELIS